MFKHTEMLGVKLTPEDKTLLRQIADINRLTMSDLARLILTDGLEHFNEHNFLRPG
jgi:uncharacterized protein (DUF1778 family)